VKKIPFLALCPAALLLVSCLLSRDVIAFDPEPGKARQRELVAGYFAGLDARRAPEGWPPAGTARREAVSAAWWGFDPADSTAFLQRALDCGAAVVLVPRMSSPWTCEDIYVRSRTTLILEDGAVLLARAGAFQRPTQSLLNILDADDVTVLGYGATIRMRRSDYWRPPYARGEWRHTIQICGGNRVTVAGLTAELSGGDGVYLGRGATRVTNTDVLLKDLVLRDHYRQGVSVITARNLTIENTEIGGTTGTPPGAGIDFEPNLPDDPVANCVLRRCRIHDNEGAGFQCYFINHDAASEPFDITLDRCLIDGNLLGALAFGFDRGARGKIALRGTRIYGVSILRRITGQVEITEE
jgi:hypothetical protein